MNLDQAAPTYPHFHPARRIQPPFRQRPQQPHFVPPGVQRRGRRSVRRTAFAKLFVIGETGEVATAALHQRLRQRLLEAVRPVLAGHGAQHPERFLESLAQTLEVSEQQMLSLSQVE